MPGSQSEQREWFCGCQGYYLEQQKPKGSRHCWFLNISNSDEEGDASASGAEMYPRGVKVRRVILKRSQGQQDFSCEVQDELDDNEKEQESQKVKKILEKVNNMLKKNKNKHKGKKLNVFVFWYRTKKAKDKQPKNGEEGAETPSTSQCS